MSKPMNPLHELKRYLKVIARRKILFSAVFVLISAGFIVFSYTLPKKYKAESTVFIEENVIQSLIKGLAVTPSVKEKVKVLKVTMLSRTMLLSVINELDMDAALVSTSEKEALINELRRSTSIHLNEARGVFTISFQHEDKRMARDYVNTLIRNYIAQSTSTEREDSIAATNFLAEQIATYQGRIATVDGEIEQFQREHGQKMAQSESFLLNAIAQSEQNIEQLLYQKNALQLKMDAIRKTGSAASASDDGKSETVKAMESQLAMMRSRYSPLHPKVQNAERQLEELIKHESGVVASTDDGGEATTTSTLQKTQLQALRLDLNVINERIARSQKVIDTNRGLLSSLPTLRSELASLQKKKSSEENLYNQLVTRYNRSQVSKEMELQDKSISFRVVDPAVLPADPISPNRVSTAGLGLGFALAAAFGIIFILDFLNGAIKAPKELNVLNIPVMAVLPMARSKKEIRFERFAGATVFAAVCAYLVLVAGVLALEYTKNPMLENFFKNNILSVLA